jgi:hypothetical protein
MSESPDPWSIYSRKIATEYPIALQKKIDAQYIKDWSNYIKHNHPKDEFKYMQKLYRLLEEISKPNQLIVETVSHRVPISDERIVIALDHVSYGRLVNLRNKDEEKRIHDREVKAKARGVNVDELKPYKLPITWERIL